MNSIFPTLSLDRFKIHWEDYLHELTPIEFNDGLWFKREDAFAPLGENFINGGKVRQGIYIFDQYVRNNYDVIIGAMSIDSPQHSMQAVVAKHFGINSLHIIGATTPITALKKENIAIAAWMGAKFRIQKVAYNPALQRAVKEFIKKEDEFNYIRAKQKMPINKIYPLGYAISIDHHDHLQEEVEAFHRVGAHQVKNIPDHIENIIIPAGSCNSTTSILYGIAKFKPKNLKNVYLIGIGPNKIDLIEERLDIIEEVSGINTKPFKRNYVNSKDLQYKWENGLLSFLEGSKLDYSYNLHHVDLHSTGVYTYHQTEECNWGSKDEKIIMHPRYEAKALRWIINKQYNWLNDKTLFWIVGAEPKLESVYDRLKDELGEIPKTLKEF